MIEYSPEQVVVLIDSPDLQKIVTIWAHLETREPNEIAEKTGLAVGYIQKALPILYGNNIIGEQGEVNTHAINLIKSRVINSMKGKR